MSPTDEIDRMIAAINDWRGEMLSTLRRLILAADPGVFEEWKWMGSPVWSCDGILVVGNAHKGKVKLTFDHGARLADPLSLFNAGLEGNQRRAIDFFEGDRIDETGLQDLVRAAIAYNRSRKKSKSPAAGRRAPASDSSD